MKTNFIPSEHGFSFANRFPGYPLPLFLSTLPTISKILSRDKSFYGLCGGMTFAAYDYFIGTTKIPMTTTIPETTTELYRYLYQRQIDSYGKLGEIIAKFAYWMILPDSRISQLSYKELKKACQLLSQGKLVVLGLVYISFWKSLAIWINHQVLAYDYLEYVDGNAIIKIYDPNLPKHDNIAIEIVNQGTTGLQFIQKVLNTERQVTVRGFFVIPYEPKKPLVFKN